MLQFFAVLHVIISAALVGLILMHSGRDAGLGGMGFTPASQGGTHIVERNLTRLTIAVAVLFTANTVLLFPLLKYPVRSRRAAALVVLALAAAGCASSAPRRHATL